LVNDRPKSARLIKFLDKKKAKAASTSVTLTDNTAESRNIAQNQVRSTVVTEAQRKSYLMERHFLATLERGKHGGWATVCARDNYPANRALEDEPRSDTTALPRAKI